MGSKLLNAVSVRGESIKRFGTGGIVNTTNGRNILPTRNFQKGHFDQAMNLSGEFIEDHKHHQPRCDALVRDGAGRARHARRHSLRSTAATCRARACRWSRPARSHGCIFTTYGMIPKRVHEMNPARSSIARNVTSSCVSWPGRQRHRAA